MNTPSPAVPVALPELPSNVAHIMRRIRACESEVPAQLVLEHALRQYALAALKAAHPPATYTGESPETAKQVEDYLAVVEAAQVQPSVAGWLPMESAPKDGTNIILAWGGSARTSSYLDNSKSRVPWAGWRVPSLELQPKGSPTAWQPFPKVPA